MRFWKGQALGNDYLVIDASESNSGVPEPEVVRALCDRHRGAGSDGVLVGDPAAEPVTLRIFNPDGSEAEKSGNGLRIFGAWLHLRGLVGEVAFQVTLPGETVTMRVESVDRSGARLLRVDMGRAVFRAGAVGFKAADPDDEVVGRPLDVDGQTVAIHTVSTGNPHCVVFLDPLDPAVFRRFGPALQSHPSFDRGVNVQFARVAGPGVLEALIWERGAGETLASGSSACAVVAAARRAGLVDGERFEVRMRGGSLEVELDDDYALRLTGPAQIVYEATLDPAVLEAWRRNG